MLRSLPWVVDVSGLVSRISNSHPPKVGVELCARSANAVSQPGLRASFGGPERLPRTGSIGNAW